MKIILIDTIIFCEKYCGWVKTAIHLLKFKMEAITCENIFIQAMLPNNAPTGY